jgi:hypothetical protein
MEDEIEFKVWRSAQQACSKVSFARLLEEAVASFKRVPGFDPIVRLGVGIPWTYQATDIGFYQAVLPRLICLHTSCSPAILFLMRRGWLPLSIPPPSIRGIDNSRDA